MASGASFLSLACRVLAGAIGCMHGLSFNGPGFVNNALKQTSYGGIRQRAGIGTLGIFQNLLFPLLLIQGHVLGLLDFSHFQRATRALIEQFHQLAVDFVDAAAPVAQSHGATSRRDMPWRAASFSEATSRAKALAAASTAAGDAFEDVALSISDTNAEPTTAASASPPRMETWPGSEIPKPTAMGRCVTARARRSNAGKSSGKASRAPVTPVREMR